MTQIILITQIITHLEPDILEYKVKWALGSIATNKARWNSSWAISNPKTWCCDNAALNMPANMENSTVTIGYGTMDWFQTGKGVHQGHILSPCLFNLYAEYIMINDRLGEAQAGIKIARRNTNNFRYADDTTLMAEREEKIKSHSMKVREPKSWLKTQHFKKLRSWHPVSSLHGK